MRLSIAEIVQATDGELVVAPATETLACDLTWDSRTASAGCAYLALPGEKVDGHSFAAAAIRSGAVCTLVEQDPSKEALAAAREAGAAIVRVADTRIALTDLARAWRAKIGARVIGLTGSSGKTTTKNLVRDVLSAAFAVTATSGNQNNELGVPKTVLGASEDDDALVVEMGMRGMGQIEQLCGFVKPDWGIVVNVGTSHMELLGSRENIARAKAELLEALPSGGWAFLNGDDDFALFMRERARLDERGVRVAVFDGSLSAAQRMAPACGTACDGVAKPQDARVWAEDIDLDEGGRPSFMLHAAGFPDMVQAELAVCGLSLRGLHNVGNACAAAAVGLAMGMSLDAVARALSGAQAENGRAQVVLCASGAMIVDDSYNANPDSMRASLRTFAAMNAAGRKIAVLGDMGELGPFSQEGHRQVGRDAAAAGLDELVCVGPLARGIAQAAIEAGFPCDRVSCVDNAAGALEAVSGTVAAGDAVLVKASHSVGLERVVEGLVG